MKNCLRNQKVQPRDIQLTDAPLPEDEKFERLESLRESNVLTSATLILIGIVIGAVLMGGFRACTKDEIIQAKYDPWVNLDCRGCHNRLMAMVIYFERAGNRHPKQSAEAVLATKRPKLIASIIVKGEKNTPYWKRNHGWKNRHNGMGGVNEKDWGKVPNDPIGQAKQMDRILDELLHGKPPKVAISHYGGDSTDNYWNQVSAEIQRVP